MSKHKVVMAVPVKSGGEYEIGYFEHPEIKSGWVPLARVYANDPSAREVVAVVRALQTITDCHTNWADFACREIVDHFGNKIEDKGEEWWNAQAPALHSIVAHAQMAIRQTEPRA